MTGEFTFFISIRRYFAHGPFSHFPQIQNCHKAASLYWSEAAKMVYHLIRDKKKMSSIDREDVDVTRSHSALETANYAINYCVNVRGGNNRITNLQLQKILYFIQYNYCRDHNGEFLFEDDFEAWKYGPVVPAVYYKYAIWGGLPIDEADMYPSPFEEPFAESDLDLIIKTIEQWIEKDPWMLVAESHKEGTPWYQTYNQGSGLKKVIDKKLIAEYARKNA